MTPENLREPWIHFEAGALAKKVVETGKVVPCLCCGLEPGHLAGTPLASFQAKTWSKADTQTVVLSMNEELKKPLAEERVKGPLPVVGLLSKACGATLGN